MLNVVLVDRQKLLIIAAVIVTILIIILSFGLKKDRNLEPVTLEMWGVYDDQVFYEDLISSYLKKNKHVTINYHEKTFTNYEEELVNALAADQGPDIFGIHNTWLPKHKDKIKPIEQGNELLSFEKLGDVFVDVVSQDFIRENKIYAIPFYADTLALYYNKDLFNSAGISSPPNTWEEFIEDAEKLTKKDEFGNIKVGGAALGTAKNINRSTDILNLLMLQAGAKMIDDKESLATFNNRLYVEGESFTPGEDAFRFFTDFSNPAKKTYSWNRQMPYSIDAFYQGKVAMMLNYSHHIDTIKEKSPYLNFAITPAPQLKEREFDINYANYWGYAVSKNSTKQEEAWKFILFLSEKNNNKDYLEKSKRPTARRNLIEWQRDSDLTVFANQALSARSWRQVNNQAIETIMADMIESVVLGSSTIKKALDKAAAQVTILMK